MNLPLSLITRSLRFRVFQVKHRSKHLYLLLAQDPVVSLSLCDRLKPVLGSGGSLLLQLRDDGREEQDADWLVSAVLSVSDDDDVARLPREEDFELDDELPMAAELFE